jgi:hypothetical protein
LPALKEIINQETGLLVPLGKDFALEESIEKMLDSYRIYSPERISRNVRLKYNYENVGRMLSQVYREALKETYANN